MSPARLILLFLLAFACLAFVCPSLAGGQTFWVAGTDAAGQVMVAQGTAGSNGAEFKSDWRMHRAAKPQPRKLRITNELNHAVKILYYDAGDNVRWVAAGTIHLNKGQSSNFPARAHQIKVFKPAIFDQHLVTSGVLRGHVTLRKRKGKVKCEGGTRAPTMEFVNASQETVKICIYDRTDTIQAIPKKIVHLKAGRRGSWKVEGGTHKVKVFCPAIFDEWLADGNFPYNSVITIQQGYYAATGLTVAEGFGVGVSLYSWDNSVVDGAAIGASKLLYYFDQGELKVGQQTAQAFPPFRFLQSADFGWGNVLDTGIAASSLRGTPAAATYDQYGKLDIPHHQTRLYGVSQSGQLLTTTTLKWDHFAAIGEWNTDASWTQILGSGVTHVAAGSRVPFPKGAIYVVHRKMDGTLHGAHFDRDTQSTDWEALGGGPFQGGAAVHFHRKQAYPGNPAIDRIDVFAVKTNGDLMRRTYLTPGGWSAWSRQRSGCHGTPDIYRASGPLHIAVGIGNGDVGVRKRALSGEWGPWSTIPGDIVSSPVIYTLP